MTHFLSHSPLSSSPPSLILYRSPTQKTQNAYFSLILFSLSFTKQLRNIPECNTTQNALGHSRNGLFWHESPTTLLFKS